MLHVSKITTQYHVVEDRLRLSARAGDDVVVLWLTQRLLNALLPELFAWLEQRAESRVVSDQQLMQEFMQQDAMVAKNKEPVAEPVKVQGASSEWLVLSVDITKNEQLIRLVFNDESKDLQAALKLNNTSLRQWLNAVFLGYRKAQWPTGHWPDWMRQAGQAQKVKQAH